MKTIYNNILRLLLVALMAMPLLATAQVTLTGSGTADDPYLIGTADELEAFATIVNTSPYNYQNPGKQDACAKLTADIDYTGKTKMIGDNFRYKGIFDGDNHTITVNFNSTTIYTALFCQVGDPQYGNPSVSIKNLNVVGNITSTKQYSGGVVGLADWCNLTIENVTSSVTITYTGAYNTYNGGIIGLIYSSNSASNVSVLIKNCGFNGKFVGGAYNGGIVGKSNSNNSNYVEIRDSYSCCPIQKNSNYGVIIGEYQVSSYQSWQLTNRINGCYYLLPDNMDDMSDVNVLGVGLSMTNFSDGSACRMLNHFDENGVWRQNRSGVVDKTPVPNPSHAKVSNVEITYPYAEVFETIDIKGSLNGNVIHGANETSTLFDEDGFDGYGKRFLTTHSYPSGSHPFPKTFDNETATIKNYSGANIPFNISWAGDNDFEGNDCIHLAKFKDLDVTTVNLETPTCYKELYILATCGGLNANTPAMLSVEIGYNDEAKSKMTTSFFVMDIAAENNPTSYIVDGYDPTAEKSGVGKYCEYNVYCFPLNDALDPTKAVESIKFTSGNEKLCVGIFAITGLIYAEPKSPSTVFASCDASKMTLSWSKVEKLVNDKSAGSLSYVYDIADDSEFNNIVSANVEVNLDDATLSGGMYTIEVAGNYYGKYIRMRAVNFVGPSTNTVASTPKILYDDAQTGQSYTDAITAIQTNLSSWNGQTIDLVVNHTFIKNGYYNTICLPFAVTNLEESPLTGCELKKLSNVTVTPSDKIEIVLENATEIEAGVPYFIKWDSDDDLVNPVFTGVTISAIAGGSVTKGNTTLYGTLWPVQLPSQNQNYLFLHDNNTFAWPNGENTYLRGTRAYFQITDSKARYGMPTSIVDNPDADIEIEEPEVQKLYQNGRIVIIKDGVKYDLFGRILE